MVSPPPDVGSGATATVPPARTGTSSISGAEAGAPAPSGLSGALDRADIRPLDVPAALQILIAEVRAVFAEAGNASDFSGGAAAASIDGAVPAARVIVEMVLQSLPETFEPNSWSAALPRSELALQAAVQRALDVVGAWRDATPEVLAATQESGALALRLITDEPPFPTWPPPEWLGLAPRLTRLWRRRRALRRRLVDPDYAANTKWDELDELGP